MSGPAPSLPVIVAPDYIEIVEPDPDRCPTELSPETDEKLSNYKLLGESVRAYAPISDIYTSPEKGKLEAKIDVCPSVPPHRARILELVRPGDPGREALEAIVRPARRALALPLDEDTQRFLKRVLSPRPQPTLDPPPKELSQNESDSNGTVSLADELREAEDGRCENRLHEFGCGGIGGGGSGGGGGGMSEAMERERLGRLALSVEQDEWGGVGVGAGSELCAAARRLDALLAESRALHGELAAIQRDLQTQAARAHRCSAAARALGAESRALGFLDDVVALLRGDVAAAGRARAWPFALGAKRPDRNYIV